MKIPIKKVGPMGFQTFEMNGKPCTRQDMINHLIEQGGNIFSYAFTEPDCLSKSIYTDGERIWKEDFFGKYLYDI